jgi:polyisoprenoid-binding protein YceI
MKILFLMFLLAVAGAASAQTVLPEGSEIRFVTKQMGVPVEGRFTRWQAQVKFDPIQLPTSQVSFSIDTRSIAFGAADTEAEAAKPAWFHSAQFPQAQFKSTAIRGLGPGRYEVTGTLSIKGQQRDVVVPVLLVPGPTVGQGAASGSFTLKRMDFKLGEGEWSDLSVVANDVQVRFKLQLANLLSP